MSEINRETTAVPNNPFAVVARQVTMSGHAFDVQKVRFRLPDGREREYDLVDHADAVTILPVDEAGNIWFVTQYRIGAMGKMLELPAGVMDEGETPLESAHRELREEIGMDCREMKHLGGFWMAAGYSNEFMNCFLARGLIEAPLEQDEDEFLSLSKMPIEQAYQMAAEGGIVDGKTLSTLLLARQYLLAGN
ncbi:MAG: NUDIX hydrolase [Chloroflexi bacterium]|nr:NUDIX hydrolase [Chloroflexota bacterium]